MVTNDGQRNDGVNRMIRTAGVIVAWSIALAVALGTGMPAVAAEVTHDGKEDVPAEAAMVPPEGAGTDAEQSIKGRAPGVPTKGPMALFQLPPTTHGGETPARQLIQRLKYQYSYGSESEITYRRNPDLDNRIRDNLLILKPQLNGMVVYRPSSWLETTLELILEREFAVHEEKAIPLPNGETQYAPKRRTSLLVDQAFVTIRPFTSFELNVGRRNYEDGRHWLYDTSIDIASVALKKGPVRVEAFAGREVMWDLDLLDTQVKDRINTYMYIVDYRGIEDIRLTGYVLIRDDQAKKSGKPALTGLSANGMPSDKLSFWTTLAYMRGTDEQKKRFLAYAYDVGGTYRFTNLPLRPSITLGYAYATGDGNPNDNKNTEFRQTGLQSNEGKFDGVSKFKVYGETLDPELSNLKILTAGLGLRPVPNVSVDFVYHHYRLDEIADEIRNSALTALMNQDDTQLSKDMGSAFDLVVGIRNLFGIRRLGLDLRQGWFFPGKAFRNEDATTDPPVFRHAERGSNVVAKFWW
jgi:alginate production protein